MNLRLAFRNVFRNRWRSALTAGGIAVAVGMLIWVNCMNEAFFDIMVDSSVGKQLGDVQIHDPEYVDEPTLFHSFEQRAGFLDAVQGAAGVGAVSPRVFSFGLVGHETRSVVGRVMGVDPAGEASVSGVDRGVEQGRWLAPEPAEVDAPREVVVGKALARQLEVKTGDELVLFMSAADGSQADDVLKVVGVTSTGNSDLDRMALYMHLPDVQFMTALEGRLHEVAIKAAHGFESRTVADAVRAAVASAGEGPVTRAWQEIMPEFEGLLDFAREQAKFMYFIIGLIAALGIFNTQRMSVLERRREFGVLLAVGLAPRKLGGIVVLEALTLTLIGAAFGVLWGGGLSWYHAVAGLDFAAFNDQLQSLDFNGISMGSRMYFLITPRAVVEPVVVLVTIAGICGLFPAISAARLDAVRAISGRT